VDHYHTKGISSSNVHSKFGSFGSSILSPQEVFQLSISQKEAAEFLHTDELEQRPQGNNC